jgi:putative flippase GtrA
VQKSAEFLRFCGVGVIGFVVDSAVLYGSAPYLGWLFARLVSFLVAASVTWYLNRRLTFISEAKDAAGSAMSMQYAKYLASMALGGVLNLTVYALTIATWKFYAAPILGVALGSCAGLALNFVIARHIMRGD